MKDIRCMKKKLLVIYMYQTNIGKSEKKNKRILKGDGVLSDYLNIFHVCFRAGVANTSRP